MTGNLSPVNENFGALKKQQFAVIIGKLFFLPKTASCYFSLSSDIILHFVVFPCKLIRSAVIHSAVIHPAGWIYQNIIKKRDICCPVKLK